MNGEHIIKVTSIAGLHVGNKIDINGFIYGDGTTFDIIKVTPDYKSSSGENEITIVKNPTSGDH